MQHSYLCPRRWLGAVALLTGLLTGLIPTASAQWVEQDTNFPNTSIGVRDIEVVSVSTVWITVYDGTTSDQDYNDFSRTTNGGATWLPGSVAPAAGLGFATLSAVSATTAWAGLLDLTASTSGGGELYKTTDGGVTWTRQLASGFQVSSGGFLNAVEMLSATNGVVMGDPLSTTNEFEVYTTTNGGTTWTPVPAASLPNSLSGEYGYSALMTSQGTSNVWFGTNKGRVYRSTNGGTSWTAVSTGLTEINQMAFSSATHGLAMQRSTSGALTGLARTTDGGASWARVTTTGPVFTNDLQAVPGTVSTYLTAGAVASNMGSSYSTDGGSTWRALESSVPRTAIGAADVNNVWAGTFTDASTGAGGIVKGSVPPPGAMPPDWMWARGLGNNSLDGFTHGVATDAAGNVYVVGQFQGTATFGITTLTSIGDYDGYLAKYNAQGVLQWLRRFGGSGADVARSVAVDAAGDMYLTGSFSSTVSFGAGVTATSVGATDAFVAKYSSAGTPLWVQTGGGFDSDICRDVVVDGAGNVYAAGAFGGINDPDATFGASYASGLTVTSAGDVTITGPFGTAPTGGTSGGVATFETTDLISAGGSDGFVARYSSAGTLQWARRFGGSTGDDGANSVATDAAGNTYVAGYFRGSLTFAGTTLTTGTTIFNSLLLSYSATGTPRWAQGGIGAANGSGYQIATDAAGDVYFTGFFRGTTTFDNETLTPVTDDDAMLVKFNGTTGASVWVTSAGGDNNDYGRGLAIDAGGNIYLAGTFGSAGVSSTGISFGSTLSLTNAGGIDSYLVKLGSNCTLAVPSVTVSGPLCAGQTLTLAATGIATGTTLLWTGPNGFSATTANITIPNATAAASGLYTLTVTSATLGCSVTASATATVETAPATPTATGTFTRCGPGAQDLTVTSNPGDTFRWYSAATGGTPIAGATGPTYTTPSLSATTTYYVSALSSAGCEGPRQAVTATIGTVPTVSVTAGGPTTFCAGGSVTLTAAGSPGVTYQWSTGSTLPTTTITTTQSNVTVTVTNAAGCTATSTPTSVVATTTSAPTATGAASCGSGTVTLTAGGAPAGATYQWYTTATGGATIAGATGPTYTTPSLSATTTYYVSVVSAVGACESTRTPVTATVNAAPTVALAAVGATTFCDGNSVTLAAAGSVGATYQFTLNGSPIPGATNTTFVATQGGVYSVTVATAGNCTASATPLTVTVLPAPAQPTVTAVAQGALMLLLSSAPTGNQWYLKGAPIVGATGATYRITAGAQNGVYTVVVTNGTCPSLPSAPQNVSVTGTAADQAAAVGLTLFPNPTADGRVTLTLAPVAPNARLTVLDAAGRTVLTRALSAGTTRYELDVRALPAGVYAVRVGTAVRRLVRE